MAGPKAAQWRWLALAGTRLATWGLLTCCGTALAGASACLPAEVGEANSTLSVEQLQAAVAELEQRQEAQVGACSLLRTCNPMPTELRQLASQPAGAVLAACC